MNVPSIGTHATLQDLRSLLQPNNEMAKIIEILDQTNVITQDLLFEECNGITSHTSTVRTGLPPVYYRSINQGVPSGKATSKTIVHTPGSMEAYLEVDKKLVSLQNSQSMYMTQHVKAQLESFGQRFESLFFYGNQKVQKESITGLSTYYSTVNKAVAQNAENVLDAGGQGIDNTSVWLVTHGEMAFHGIYPKGLEHGGQYGVTYNYLGEQTAENFGGTGLKAQVYRAHFTWNAGLALPDWRSCSRICNIDVSNLRTAGQPSSSAPALLDFMEEAIDKCKKVKGKKVFYMNDSLVFILRRIMRKEAIATLQFSDLTKQQGDIMFHGIPIRGTDGILLTESVVS